MPTVTSKNKAKFDEAFYEQRKGQKATPDKKKAAKTPPADMGAFMERYEANKRDGKHFHNLLRMAALHGDAAAHDAIMDLYEKHERMESVPKSAKQTLQGFHDSWYPKIADMA